MEKSEDDVDLEPKKLARQLDFTADARAQASVFLPEHPQTLLQLNLQSLVQSRSPALQEPVQPMQQLREQAVLPVVHQAPPPVIDRTLSSAATSDSLKSYPCSNIELQDGTRKKQKQCNCKKSKCLKLYCECFASGIYCDGCNCSCCHNNIEHEAARQNAVGLTLERSPCAFRSKIINSPHGNPQDRKEKVGEAAIVGKHHKGCNCKRSGCLKKYCECFQAGILCSENCKCLDCKNFEGSEDRRALLQGIDFKTYMQQTPNSAISGAIGYRGYGTPLAFKKRKIQENMCSINANNQSIGKYQKDIPQRASTTSSSTLSTASALGSSKPVYRSPLADVLREQDIKEFCSLMVTCSTELSKALADKRRTIEKQVESGNIEKTELYCKENDVQIAVENGHLANSQVDSEGSDGSDVQNERPMSPATLALMCDEKDTIGHTNGDQNTNHESFKGPVSEDYPELERFVLSRTLEFLKRLITCGSIKETNCSLLMKAESETKQESDENESIQIENETKSNKESNINVIAISNVSQTETVTADTTVCNGSHSLMDELPMQNGLSEPKQCTNAANDGSAE